MERKSLKKTDSGNKNTNISIVCSRKESEAPLYLQL